MKSSLGRRKIKSCSWQVLWLVRAKAEDMWTFEALTGSDGGGGSGAGGVVMGWWWCSLQALTTWLQEWCKVADLAEDLGREILP